MNAWQGCSRSPRRFAAFVIENLLSSQPFISQLASIAAAVQPPVRDDIHLAKQKAARLPINKMRRVEAAALHTGSTHQGGNVGTDGAFAIGAGDMHGLPGLRRVLEERCGSSYAQPYHRVRRRFPVKEEFALPRVDVESCAREAGSFRRTLGGGGLCCSLSLAGFVVCLAVFALCLAGCAACLPGILTSGRPSCLKLPQPYKLLPHLLPSRNASPPIATVFTTAPRDIYVHDPTLRPPLCNALSLMGLP